MPMRVLRVIIFVLIALVAVGASGLYWYFSRSLPVHAGAAAVAGLSDVVTISRDAQSVPRIRAASEDDAIFALGYVHAQDRLWQLDFNRRVAQGRLAEILGGRAVTTDRFLRSLGVARAAQAIVQNTDADTRAKLAVYAAGINAYLAEKRPLPPEFILTRSPAPAPWQPEDSVAWAIMMAWDLSSHGMRNELARLRLSSKLTRAEIEELRPPYPGDQPLAVADYVEMYRLLGLNRSATGRAAAEIVQHGEVLALGGGEGLGSNNWVAAGTRTANGAPLLANDPHLGLMAPALWYFVALQAPGFEVFGATLPGVPYVLLGRNRHVAWGFTNTGSDVQDVYIERLNPANPEEYQTPDGYTRFESRSEVIKVREAPDVLHVVRSTRHGPVISGALSAADQALPTPAGKRGYVLALRWTALEPQDTTMRAVRGMNLARDAEAFERAARDWQLVQQNIVFADDAGNIGMVAPGRVPLRRETNDLSGLVPAPGWDARYDWAGWLPYEALPRSINPDAGMIVTANHKITPPGYPHYLTTEWHLPYRARRIEQLLQAEALHTANSYARIQSDIVSLAALDAMAVLKDTKPESEAARIALARLVAWDGQMRLDAPEPVLLHAWLRNLRARIFNDDLAELATDFVANAELMQATLNALLGVTGARDWCDDRSTPRRETCLELAAESLEVTVADLARATGSDITTLRWSDQHRAIYEHRPFSNVALLRDWFQLAIEHPGDTFTVNVGQLSLRGDKPFNTRHAASLRAVYDLAPGAGAQWIYGGGQVGHVMSDHYRDLLQDWARGAYRAFDWQGPENAKVFRLTPRGSE
ncbi:MAG TPA: penicillin acylase family protein [Burkholderiaceae bacterium]|nr:penicillin acylase family protein [Burkholderiaceae bacterium]